MDRIDLAAIHHCHPTPYGYVWHEVMPTRAIICDTVHAYHTHAIRDAVRDRQITDRYDNIFARTQVPRGTMLDFERSKSLVRCS